MRRVGEGGPFEARPLRVSSTAMVQFIQEWRDVTDRTGWGDGPWDGEPDKVVWIDEATDLDCMARRSPFGGNWCGYVAVPPGHPWHGKGYDEVDPDVHGGLTFADECHDDGDPAVAICHVPQPGRPADVWWLGFDCHHGMDVAPGFAARMRAMDTDLPPMPSGLYDGMTYRDLDYVVTECMLLAAQVAVAR